MEIVAPSIEMADLYKDYVSECFESGISHYEAAVENPVDELQSVIDAAKGENLPDGYLPYKTFFAILNGKICGTVRYRIGTIEFCEKNIGHIGYETRPSRRNFGIAKSLYSYVVSNHLNGQAMVMCTIDNIGSIKVIESLPHKVLREEYNAHEDAVVRTYLVE